MGMKTIVIQIGYSDNKLTQKEWSDYVDEVHRLIQSEACAIHFFGGSSTYAPWQNVCIVAAMSLPLIAIVSMQLHSIRQRYRQDSIAVLSGDCEFI